VKAIFFPPLFDSQNHFSLSSSAFASSPALHPLSVRKKMQKALAQTTRVVTPARSVVVRASPKAERYVRKS